MKQLTALLLLTSGMLLAGCSTLTLTPVDYAWPIEIRPETDVHGFLRDDRTGLAFNVKPLMFAETADSSKVGGISFRIIRDAEGYYYVVAPKFKNVYVFAGAEGALKLKLAIPVSQTGLVSPALNQRTSFIQLVNGKDKPLILTKNGIQEGEKK
ncbi:MAG: hypothetical protein NTV54_09160 [Ignavibacteriales bacterium]|nr:hypothetical protein [Ignavibacteriales bacterium]